MKNKLMVSVWALVFALGAQAREASTQYPAGVDTKYPSLEFWNKTDKPVYFALHASAKPNDDTVLSEPLTELKAGKRMTDRFRDISLTNYARLLITDNPDSDMVTVYTFNPGKHIWVRVKEENKQLVFGPQTGPLLGLVGTTERGYPQNKNVSKSDYREDVVKRSAWQKVKKGAKGLMYEYVIE